MPLLHQEGRKADNNGDKERSTRITISLKEKKTKKATKKKTSKQSSSSLWPTESSSALPLLSQDLQQALYDGTLQFETSAEPCSLKLSPTGRLLAVSFNDGTLRLYDMTGHYHGGVDSSSNQDLKKKHFASFDPRFGCVTAQLPVKGIHSSLVTTVDVSPDAQWFFCGALRGCMELLAVHVGELEEALDAHSQHGKPLPENMLDLVTVYRHADAKLKGFGACTRIQAAGMPQYLLLSGRGIKNCHVWRFLPPITSTAEPAFHKIMDLPTNGNTISFSQFLRQPKLQIVTKSKNKVVQCWDIQSTEAALRTATSREPCFFPRPSSQDVRQSEAALGVAGGFAFCGGSERYLNSISVVPLRDKSHATELSLPPSSSQQQQQLLQTNTRRRRGDLQSAELVAAMPYDADHVLLELSDEHLVHYCAPANHQWPTLRRLEHMPGFGWLQVAVKRKIEVSRVSADGICVAVAATFDPYRGRGSIYFTALDEQQAEEEESKPRTGFWGYCAEPLRLASPSQSKTATEGNSDSRPMVYDHTPKLKAPVNEVVSTGSHSMDSKAAALSLSERFAAKDLKDHQIQRRHSFGGEKTTSKELSKKQKKLLKRSASSSCVIVPKKSNLKSQSTLVKNVDPLALFSNAAMHVASKGLKRPSEAEPKENRKKAKTVANTKPPVSSNKVLSASAAPTSDSLRTPLPSQPKKKKLKLHKSSSRSTLSESSESSTMAPNAPVIVTDSKKQPRGTPLQSNQHKSGHPEVSPDPSPPQPRKVPGSLLSSGKPDEVEVGADLVTPGRLTSRSSFNTSTTVSRAKSRQDSFIKARQTDLVEVCQQQLTKLESLLAKCTTFPLCQSSSAPSTSRQWPKRQQLMTEHRAAQDFLWKRAIRVTIGIVNSLEACPTKTALVQSKSFLDSCLNDVQQILDDLLVQQRLEADAFMARHRLECDRGDVMDIPVVAVRANMKQCLMDLFPKWNCA